MWCEYHGVAVENGIATLFKAVDDSWRGPHGSTVSYEPGSTPEAPDWDGGKQECGGGLHFSPSPMHAAAFWPFDRRNNVRFVACPVRVDQLAIHPGGMQPDKVKAPRVCNPVFEVDVHGDRIEEPVKT
jgi:hypothetical protein